MGDWVAPCFEYSAAIAIFAIEGGRIADRIDFPLRSREPFDRVRLLRDQQVGTVICGGVQEIYESSLRATGIHVISWVSGTVDDLLELYLRGQLVPGAERERLRETGLSSDRLE
jgi:predicted Fe-Mo cluster-binding NifX family protein